MISLDTNGFVEQSVVTTECSHSSSAVCINQQHWSAAVICSHFATSSFVAKSARRDEGFTFNDFGFHGESYTAYATLNFVRFTAGTQSSCRP